MGLSISLQLVLKNLTIGIPISLLAGIRATLEPELEGILVISHIHI